MLTATQLANRADGIGASEVACILLGQTPWTTQRGLWALKTGRMDPQPENESTSIGNRWEAVAAAEVQDATERRVVKPTSTYRAQSNDIMFANLDRQFDKPARGADVCEIKNTIMPDGWGLEGSDQIPAMYLLQVQAQMLCSGSGVACVARLKHGHGWPKLSLYWVKADAELMRMIEDRVCGWWERHVEADTPPEGAATPDEIKRWTRTPGKAVTVDDILLADFIAKHEAKKAAEEAEKDAWAAVTAAMGDGEIAVNTQGEIVLTFKQVKGRVGVDQARLKTEYPDVYARVLKQGAPYRRRHILKEASDE